MDANFTVRDYIPNDYPSILNIWQQTGLGSAQRGDNQQVIEQSIAMGGKLLIAANHMGEIVGTSWVTFDGRRLHLHHFGVKPAYQGKGIGNLLTKATLQFAKSKGIQIKLEVHKDNHKAIALYKKYGFNYLGDYDVYIIRDLNGIGV